MPKAEEGRTKILLLQNLRFIRDGKVMSHDDSDSELDIADCLAITFEMQKKDDKNNTVHHEATRDQTMCPSNQSSSRTCTSN